VLGIARKARVVQVNESLATTFSEKLLRRGLWLAILNLDEAAGTYDNSSSFAPRIAVKPGPADDDFKT
jgi:hypothetical protein